MWRALSALHTVLGSELQLQQLRLGVKNLHSPHPPLQLLHPALPDVVHLNQYKIHLEYTQNIFYTSDYLVDYSIIELNE